MTDIIMVKGYGTLIPTDKAGFEVLEKYHLGQEVKCKLTNPRNLGLHRKFFALLDVAFEAWEAPELEYKGQPVQKNLERFRKDIIILCGHYTASVNFKGEVRLDAKSMSFANMGQDEFERLYSDAITVILQKVLTRYTREDLEQQVNLILGFA